MKKLVGGIVVIMAILCTGCFDVVEELFIDKNGKGQYMITMDASGLMENGGLRSMMQSMGGEEMGDDNPFASDEKIEVDTLMRMSNAPDSIKQKFKHPELLSKMSIRQEISETDEKMITSFVFDFDNVAQINQFVEDMGNLSGAGGDGGGLGALGMGPAGMISAPANGSPLFVYGKKMLTRAKVATSEDSAIPEEEMAMVKMMLADATYTTIYNLPGRVKKTTIPNAVIDGKRLKIEYPMLDVMEGKIDQAGIIKFKKN